MTRVSRRSLVARLAATRSHEPLDDVFAEDLAARLQSLAVASSFEIDARKGRLGRKVVAVLGSIGVVGWIGVTGAAASVGLAATGNLPAPVQNVVSTVFDVVGIDVPRADDEPSPADEQAPIQVDDVLVDDTVIDGLVDVPVESSDPDDTLVSVDDTMPADAPTPPVVIDEESPVPSSRPGNSGQTPSVTAPGRKDDDTSDDKNDDSPSATAPGQSDDKNDDKPSATAPGQSDDKNDDKPSATAPGQVGRDDDDDETVDDSPSVTAPGQSNKVDKSTPPGQAKKSDDDSSSSKKNNG